MKPGQHELTIYPKHGGLILTSFIFVLLGLGFLILALIAEGSLAVLTLIGSIGVISTLIFGAALIFFIYRVVSKKPAVIVNDQGIHDYSSFTSCGTIHWEDIEDIRLYIFMGQSFIGIVPKDKEHFLAGQRGFKKLLMKLNSRMAAETPINIAQSGLPIHLEELFDFILMKWKEAEERRTSISTL